MTLTLTMLAGSFGSEADPPHRIAEELRALADRIEGGALGTVRGAVVVVERPYAAVPVVVDCGGGDPVRTLGVLHLGAEELGRLLLTGCLRQQG